MGRVAGRMRSLLPDDPANPEDWPFHRWWRVLRVRYLGILLVGVAAGALFHWWLAPLIILGVGAYNLLHEVHLHRHRRPPVWLPISDVLIGAGVIALEPRSLLPGTLVMLTAVAFAASSGSPTTLRSVTPAIAAIVSGTVALAGLAAVGRIDDHGASAVAFGVSSAMVLLGLGTLVDSEARLRRRLVGLVDQIDAVVWTCDPETHRFTYVNGRAQDLLGFSPREWQEEGFWWDRLHPNDRVRVAEAMAAGKVHDLSYRMVDAHGATVHVLDRVAPVADGAGTTTELHGVTLDVTERRWIEQRSRQFADIVEHIELPLLVTRADGSPDEGRLVVLLANPAALRLLEDRAGDVRGRPLRDLLPALAPLATRFVEVATTGRALRLDDLTLGGTGGDDRRAVIDAFPLPGGLLAISLQDTTEVSQATQALRRQALHDALTGLPNRAQLDEVMRAQVAAAQAAGHRVALLMMDLDQFKEVNDALGHGVGDRLLVAIAARLRSLLGPTTFVARLGGDEFAVLMTGPHVDEEAARSTAEVVVTSLRAPFTVDDLRLQTNVSIGIALGPDHAADTDELVRRADVAMYIAKRSGTGSATYRPEADSSSVARLTLIGDLRDAVPAGQLVLHYQPVIDLARRTVVSTEALVRWQHPEHGLIMPDEFISLAALSGATRPMAHWVLREATRAAAAWQADGHDVSVAVNLSVRNLFDRDLLGVTEAALEASGLPASQLIVELTESELMEDPSVGLAQFEAFQALGVRTSVDDFGTGYSSLTYLRDLPLSEIKVDRSFVGAMHLRGGAFTIVRSMIDMGHNLGLEVVAEGVEHDDDVPTLTRLGCDRAQGFHFARPMPYEDLRAWIDAYGRRDDAPLSVAADQAPLVSSGDRPAPSVAASGRQRPEARSDTAPAEM